jgi:hypothetical protein
VRNLSRGNIFLGAFYKTEDDADADGGEGGADCGGGDGERVILSALVDNCDSNYDKFYK